MKQIKKRLKSQEGAVLPFFAMSSIVMLLIVLLILDIGNTHIIQSDAYKAADAAALAGATQADAHELVDYEQHAYKEPVFREEPVYNYECGYFTGDEWECERIPAYTEKVFDHWKYIEEPPTRTIVDKWAEIRPKDAKELARQLFNKNAQSSTLAKEQEEDGGNLNFNAYLSDPDKITTEVDMNVTYDYFPFFSEGLFSEDVPNDVDIHKEAEGWAKVNEW
ncbi:pilus assembly protein TadG-related protein [Lentibacillus salinarum]|uniref:Pilus assembly protein TadG-related protein n=1 Tax=Lentibacillus salinarum TaxID=446820 RepID=A0ABW3ZY25_9BACI